MTEIEFYTLVKKMRDAQKKFFKDRSSIDMKNAKSLEKQVDSELSAIGMNTPNNQNFLF